MTSKSVSSACCVAALALCAQPVLAHPGHVQSGGYIAGLLHPLTGLDHLLAMIAVGLYAAKLGGRALWLLPSVFLATMAVGGTIGLSGAQVPLAEQVIAASIFVVGLLLASDAQPRLSITLPLVSCFALFHGYAHGAEMQSGLQPASYAAGFLSATAMLLLTGAALGAALTRRRAPSAFPRIAGGAIVLLGAIYLAM